MSISVQVTCNCIVNGIIVPIESGECVPECTELKKENDISSLNIKVVGNTETIMY